MKTTLQQGVAFSTATKLPDQSGQDLAWSLGTIRGYDRASVTVTVTFPILPPTTIDTGAVAFATLNAGMVTNNTPAVTLTTTPLPADGLRSTPDANTTDPLVQEQAARLRYDPNAIFNYLNNEVGYESYVGSLRGARGTLWSEAGNSLDEASLGVALFRASGIPARYAKGTLSDPLSKQLILSMFPASYQTIGYIPAGITLADPANDPQLLSETRDHYWLQVNTGSGFQNADTSGLGQTAIGAAYTTATSTFSEVADSLREKTRILLNAEVYSQIGAAFGLAGSNGLTDTVVLDRTFNTVDLVGKTLSIGHTLSYTAASAGFLTTKTTTYTPFLDIADEALGDLEQAVAIFGSAYQDVKTTFPFLTQIVTGVFLELTQSGPNGAPVTFQRTLADRIGFVTRQGLGSPNVSVDPDAPPIVGPFDVWSLSAVTGVIDPIVAVKSQARMLGVYQKVVDDASLADTGIYLSTTHAGIGQTRAYLNALLATSGNLSQDLAARSLVAAYFARPRFTMVSQTVAPRVNQGALVKFEADLISNTMRIVVSPLQSIGAGPAYSFRSSLCSTDSIDHTRTFRHCSLGWPQHISPSKSTNHHDVTKRAICDRAAAIGSNQFTTCCRLVTTQS